MKNLTEYIEDRNGHIINKGAKFCYVMEDIDELTSGAIIVEVDEVFEDNIFTTIEYGSRNFCGREGYVMYEPCYSYEESDDYDAEFDFTSLSQVKSFIEDHNRYFNTKYSGIGDYNEGEEYRKILIKI